MHVAHKTYIYIHIKHKHSSLLDTLNSKSVQIFNAVLSHTSNTILQLHFMIYKDIETTQVR